MENRISKIDEMRTRDSEMTEQVQAASEWGIGIGILMAILGLIAIARPLYAAIASTIAFAWLFMIAGIAHIVYAFQSRGAGQLVGKLLLGILYLISGIYLIFSPFAGAIALTLVLGITIFVQSVIQVIMGFQMRPIRGWGWVLFSGILGIILGIFIWSNFPFDAG
jgi:uncharacterized membrane protein HdeD (DUF308 family)